MGNTCARSELDDQTAVQMYKLGGDYKEIPDKLSGNGIKATVSWQATITRAQLNVKREEFWKTRSEGNRRMWFAIKAAVESDSATAMSILELNKLKMKKGSITILEDTDGFVYYIPVFIVNNPIEFHKEKKIKKREEKKEAETIKIKIRKSGKAEDDEFNVVNLSKVSELKGAYAKKLEIRVEAVKLFFGGKELKDNETFAKNFIENEMVVQAFVKNLS